MPLGGQRTRGRHDDLGTHRQADVAKRHHDEKPGITEVKHEVVNKRGKLLQGEIS
jgi:hypothetical protein